MPRADRPIPFPVGPRVACGLLTTLAACLSLLAPARAAHAQLILPRDQVRELKGVELDEHLGAQVPLDAEFTDADGNTVRLADFLSDGRPAILALVYYECPIVCNLVLDTIDDAVNKLDYTVGDDYRLLVVSFDHTETTTHAMNRRDRSVSQYRSQDRDAARRGMVFMTSDETNIQRLTQAVGWNFAPLPGGEWSHPVGLTILSPGGKVSRYIYGFEYPPDRLKLALLEATEGKIAKTVGERIMHYCFRYDPTAGAYSIQAMTLMRIGGILTVVLLTVTISALLLRERARSRRARPAGANDSTDLTDRAGASFASPANRFAAESAGQVP